MIGTTLVYPPQNYKIITTETITISSIGSCRYGTYDVSSYIPQGWQIVSCWYERIGSNAFVAAHYKNTDGVWYVQLHSTWGSTLDWQGKIGMLIMKK